MKIDTVLVPTDFSANAERSLAKAIQFAKVFGAQIDLLHIYDIPDLPAAYDVVFPDQVSAGIRRAAYEKLETLRDRATKEGIEASIHFVFGVPSRVIAQHAEKAKIDLIVMGTRGLGAIKRGFLGSVAERTVRTAPCPVLTVPAGASVDSEAS